MPGKLQAAPAPLVEGAAAPASFDISGVIKRVHFAYRAEGDGFYGGHGTYAVEVAGGKLRLRPLHHPDAGAEIPPQHRRGPADPQRHLPEQGNVVEGAPLELETLSIARGSARGVAPAIERGTVDADGTLRLERGGAVERLRNGEEGVEQSWEFALAPAGEGDLVVRVRAGGLRYVGATEKGLHFQDPKTGLGFRYGRASWVDAEGKSEQLAPATLADGEIVLAVPAATLMRTKYPATLDPMIGPELGLDSPVLGPSPASQTMPEIAWGGTSGLVVWRDERLGLSAVYGARVSAAGEVLDPAGFPITSAKYDHYAPSVAWNGTEWLVAWQDARRGTGYYDIYAARVSAAGAVRDPDGFAVSVGSSEAPAVAWGGTDWLVVWQDRRNGTYDIYGARVSAAGAVLDPTGFPVLARAGDQLDPAVAWGGTMWMVVWEDNRTGTSDIYGTRVTEAGVPLDPAGIPICTVSNYQWAPALAWGGTSWLVVWQSNKLDEPGDIRGGRVTETGATLDFSGFSISAAINLQGEPDVVWDGTDWLVVFEDNRTDIANRNISAARVSGSGTVLDPSGLAVSTAAQNQQMPRVAWTGTSALVVWQDYRVGGIYPDVYGARVSAAGAILDPAGIAISTSSNQQQGAAVGWDGTNWLVVWQDYRSGSSWDVYGARVTGAGVLLDPSGIAISALPRDQRAPALAWDGTNWLVVWEDLRSGTFTDVYGARVSAAGTVLDPAGFAISAGARAEALPAVASNGTGWLVVWSDYRGSASSDLYGARVSGAGAVLDPTGFAICTAAGDQGGSAVAWGGASWLVVWSDYRSGSSLGDVYGARVSGAGAVLDPSGTLIGAAGAWEAPSPKLSWNGVEWLVVWEDWRNVAWTSLDFPTLNRDVYGARVSAAGTVLDPTGIALSTADNAQAMPAVAWDGTSWLVVWQDYRSGTSWDAYGTRVSAAGALLEETGSLIQAGGQAPAVASDGSRKSLVAYHRLTPTDGTTRVFGRFYEYLLNGAACTGSQQCGSGHCVDGVCCDTACGGGGGAADCQACSKAAGAAADGTCSPLAAGTGCRPAAGVCDLAESCDGAAPECPADAKKAGTVCRAAAGECDLAEACDGVANDCPGDAFKPLDTACGDDGQVCTRDLCDGGGACRHPAGNAGTQCRAAGGVCDVAESCDGISPECPVDAKKLGTVCRGAAGECDLAESCDGVSDDCPGDAFKPTDTGCSDDGQACTRDLCDGSGSCRHPAGNAGTQCRAAAGPCDVAETCDGASPECPTDLLALPTVKCVAASCSAGILTPDAFCSGTSAACPAPALVSCGGFLCAGSACATSCAAQTDCAPGYWCEGSGACAAKGATAQECTSDAACLSGHCVDAVCCDRACAGQCEACDVAGSPGTCTPVVGSPRGGRASCASDGSPCGGACDGILTAACAYPGAGVTCRAAACASGQASLAGTCDGAGRCPAATVVACQGYLCEGDHCAGSCAGPGDCAEGYFCAAGACAAKLALGAVCPGATACLSGHCVDGVCCDRACGGQCEACGAEGVCANVTGAPKGARPACAGAAASTCAGACDGTRPDACAYPGGTVSCRPPACADAIATPEGFCDGAGGCPSATTVACAPYLCEGTRCAGDCAVDGDCAAGNWCAAGVCTPKSERGSACGAGRECLSGECVDGLCCDRACAGQCEACDVDGKKGTCAPATGAPRGARAACATDGSGCGGACDGVGGEACAYPGSEASCRGASCADGVATLAATCNGQGACPGTETVACAPYLCKGTSCAGDCAADADCAEGRWCAAGVCQPKRENGLACGAGRECLSGECADAVCCDRACGGQCEACDVEGKKGTCAPVSGAPRGGRPACAGTGGCQGSCDGTLGERCAFPGAATECSPPSCTSGIAHPASTCDGAGACRAGEDQSCGAYACGQAACLTACSSDGDCASAALRCQGGACVPKPTVVDQGCGCATADASPMLALVGLALALARRHRRRA